jgi:hypothetical protein
MFENAAVTIATGTIMVLAAACSSSSGGPAAINGGDAGPNTDAAVVMDAASTTDAPTVTDAADAEAGPAAPCALSPACVTADSTCLGSTSNAGLTKFGLRMAELDLTSPPAFSSTAALGKIVEGAVQLDDANCNQGGQGTASWLLQFDTVAKTLKTGGGKPVADPTSGYSFDTETVGGFQVQPTTFSNVAPDSTGSVSIAGTTDLVMPLFLDNAGTVSVLLPMHGLSFTGIKLSSSNDCIGAYNAAGLEVSNNCLSEPTAPGFIDGGQVTGYISLEEADKVVVSTLQTSLCAILAGGTSQYTTVVDGVTVCKRDGTGDAGNGGNIVYLGLWCSTTNMASTSSACADSEEVLGSFEASSIKILN